MIIIDSYMYIVYCSTPLSKYLIVDVMASGAPFPAAENLEVSRVVSLWFEKVCLLNLCHSDEATFGEILVS